MILIDIRNRKSNKRRANYDAISLDTAICTDADGKELTLMDLIPSDFDIEEYVIHRDELRQLRRAIAKLKQSDKELLKLYYGPNKITQEEIAKMYHTTQSAISRKIVRAINKLRKLMNVKVKGDKNGCNGDNERSNSNTRQN